MRLHIILRYNGFVLLLNAAFLLLSALVSLIYRDGASYLLFYSSIITILFGLFLMVFVPASTDISNKEGFMIVVSSWLLSCLVGILPYVLWGGEFTLSNAWFESVSGYTTTGSSILNNIESLPKGLLFWRSSTHWIGGIGILIFVLSVSPSMGRAGMILYRTEMSALAAENFHYRTRQTLKVLLYIYVGFSTKNLSIAHYGSLGVEMVVMLFMVLSGIHFGLLFGAITGKIADLWHSPVVKYYVLSMLAGIAAISLYLYWIEGQGLGESLRYSAFQAISLGTSTGFSTTDTSQWPPFTQLILIFFTLQCACAGSTSGGIKVDRVVILWKAIAKRVKKIQHPSGIIRVKVNGITMEEEVLEMNVLYISLYLGIVFLAALILTALGLDILSSFSGAAATMGNVGPGFGLVGSMSNYSHIPEVGKWVLSATMLLGRLEVYGLVLFFMARWWR
ncbi:MAG: TrkH family potassium uptake protein [Deltaproteobacteria bacterium]|nr:TrkH family potassium uptake protein [Deltaproteobacteria bacterium]